MSRENRIKERYSKMSSCKVFAIRFYLLPHFPGCCRMVDPMRFNACACKLLLFFGQNIPYYLLSSGCGKCSDPNQN